MKKIQKAWNLPHGTRICDTQLSTRTANALIRAGLITIGQVQNVVDGESFSYSIRHYDGRYDEVVSSGKHGLQKIPGLGKKSFYELLDFLGEEPPSKSINQPVIDGYIRYLKSLGYVVYRRKA